MSLATWKKKYYPVEACEVPKADALAHSIRKWEGLRLPVLEEHGLTREDHKISDRRGNALFIDSNTCALCVHYFGEKQDCERCPLAIARGGIPCDVESDRERVSPYDAFSVSGPEPMIAALHEAAEWQKAQEGKP